MSGASSYPTPVLKRAMSGSSSSGVEDNTIAGGGGAAGGSGPGGVGVGGSGSGGGGGGSSGPRSTDQSRDDVVVPLVLWHEPPRFEVTCLHVLYLPLAPAPTTGQSAAATSLMDRWPSLASFVEQWSSSSNSQLLGSSNHSLLNLRRVLSRRQSRRQSLTAGEKAALVSAISSNGNGNGNSVAISWKDLLGGEDGVEFVDADDDDDGGGDSEAAPYQLCVFAGTTDGTIVFWLLEQDVVVQVNLLIHPSPPVPYREEIAGGRPRETSPVQSLASGLDEWGQHNLVSITRDGGIARWELPSGACVRAEVDLARELAPIQGMTMFCNQRYAVVYGAQSRMMVLDMWKLTLLYCVDTAQEQVRRSIAVVELRMQALRPTGVRPSESPTRRHNHDAAGVDAETTVGSFSSFVGTPAQSNFASGGAQGPPTGSFTSGSRTVSSQPTQVHHIWDSLVISLGSEGLVKCFLWSKPRGSSSAGGASVGPQGTYQWVQESCWVISWADDADDITCSQSTSLKDGDNMNPQTALMRSIKSSYFPRALHISSDATLLLFIWQTKWVVLKRKWLCDVSPPGSNAAQNPDKALNKMNPSKLVGSCRILPSALMKGVLSGEDKSKFGSCVWWENGAFTSDNQVLLWTNTGHAFQFSVLGDVVTSNGKLFIFTKDQDQLVPRSYHKSLNTVTMGKFVAYLDQCECCSKAMPTHTSFRTEALRQRICTDERNANHGYTVTATSVESVITDCIRLVRVCKRGSVGCWNAPTESLSTSERTVTSIGTKCDRIKFHCLSEGFSLNSASDITTSNADTPPPPKVSVTHLVLGREDSRSSSRCDGPIRLDRRRRRKRWRGSNSMNGSERSTANQGGIVSSVASNMLASALSPILHGVTSSRRSSVTATPSVDGIFSQYLMDVPIITRGFTDGTMEFMLMTASRQSTTSNHCSTGTIKLQCHDTAVTAIAHCFWPASPRESDSGPAAISRSVTTGSTNTSDGVYMSARRVKTWKRGGPMEDSCLTSDKNPFYRSRFPPPAQRRSFSSRHLTGAGINVNYQSLPPPPVTATNSSHTSALVDQPAISFMVFSGGIDGALRIIELTLRPSSSSFSLEATVLQRFMKHDGPIKDIVISPVLCENALLPERLVASVGEDNVINVYAPMYTHNPFSHGPHHSSNSSRRCGIEWECILEFGEHPDVVNGIEWLTDQGQIQVECGDGMVYVWSLDTGILERAIPSSLVFEGGNASVDESTETELEQKTSVECTKLRMGNSIVHLLKFYVNESAELIKNNWKAFYYGLVDAETHEIPEEESRSVLFSASPYSVGSIELVLLSFLLSWGATPEIDRACRELLGLDSPQFLYSCVLMDPISGGITVPIPWKSIFSPLSVDRNDPNPFSRKWQHSSALSANVALGIVSLCMNLMEHKYSKLDTPNGDDSQSSLGSFPPSSPKNKEEFHVLWSQLITQHSVVLPDYVPFFREPSLEYLAKYGFHPCDYTQLGARALLNGVIKRLSPPSRSTLCAEYSTKLHCEIMRLETETGGKMYGFSPTAVDTTLVVTRLGTLVILLSMIGTCFPGEISPAAAREVCDSLVYLLRSSTQYVASVAAELLTKGLMLFRPHLVDMSSLICQLLVIDMREKLRNPGGGSPSFGSNARVLASGGSNAALSLLVELGACDTAFVLTILQQEMNNADRPHALRECILLYLTELINCHYLLMFRHLPAAVDTIMCCLDPTKPERRKRCLELSTRCLHNLVRRFPMVDFHKETQRLALGTMEAVILIYDLRTATKWRVLDGHSSAVSAVSFRSDGQILVSYAAREGSVRWWNSGNAGLFGGMLKMQQSCIKEHKLEVLRSFANAPLSSGGASADLKQVIQTCRFQFLILRDAPDGNQGKTASSGDAKERKVLRLTREDASQVQFLM